MMKQIRLLILMSVIIISFFCPLAENVGMASPVSFVTFCDAYDKKDYESIVRIFDAGLDANLQFSGDRSLLTYVAANAQDEEFAISIARLLLSKGARVNDEDSFGRAPVVYAIENNKKTLLKFLLDNGADITLHSRAYIMPVVFVPFLRKNPDLAYLVISKCPNVNVKDNLGNTTLSWAARFGYIDSVRFLINKGAAIDNLSIHLKTPLMEAAEKGHYDVVKLLVENGANVNLQTQKGWSALMWAAEKGYNDIVSLFIKAGAGLFAKNINGERALVIAKKNNHSETVKIIRKAEFHYWLKCILIVGGPIAAMILIVVIIVYLRRRR
ncbi:MAG: ankyrin repeat domain-containing protein [Syntrophaceae bacterium]|nr:ankyrin repeat domain-containing protein [Syntrophaceae bacterium]